MCNIYITNMYSVGFRKEQYDIVKVYKKLVDGVKTGKNKSKDHQDWISNYGSSQIFKLLASYIQPSEIKKTLIKQIFKDQELNLSEQYDIGVKLVIIPIVNNELSSQAVLASVGKSAKNSFVAFIKGLFNSVSQSEHFGVNHSGVSIQGCLIDWNESAFVKIADVSSSKALLAADTKFKGQNKMSIIGRDLDILLSKVCCELR